MKKLMKVIAVLTVMCFALSTAAFAAVDVTNYETKNVSISVENVQVGEQVAIIITSGDAADYEFTYETILFVDQKVADSNTAKFEAEITDSTVKAIDIYAGYASNTSTNAVKVGNDIPLVQETKLTLVAAKVVDDVSEDQDYNEETMNKVNPGTKGSVVWLKLNATNIAVGDLTQMFWAFHIEDAAGKADTKYAAGNIAALGLGTVLGGDVEIAAAFDSTGYKVTGANAIFLLKDEDVHTATGDLLEEIKGDKVEK